jgi:hypothetical protein
MKTRTVLIVAALSTATLLFTDSCQAAGAVIRGKFKYDGFATCQQPAVQDFPIHGEGTAQLAADRTATLDVDSSVSGRTHLDATLGRRTEAPGGSTTINVMGKHTLRAVRDYPNNITVVTMTIHGSECRMTIEDRLKPGKKVYTFYGGSGSVSYCVRPRITHTECTAY